MLYRVENGHVRQLIVDAVGHVEHLLDDVPGPPRHDGGRAVTHRLAAHPAAPHRGNDHEHDTSTARPGGRVCATPCPTWSAGTPTTPPTRSTRHSRPTPGDVVRSGSRWPPLPSPPCSRVWLVAFTGSVALLGDTLHNVADALTAVPLLVAFRLARRPADDRFTHGYGRAEDLAGVFVVAMIALSSLVAAWEAIDRLLDPRPVTPPVGRGGRRGGGLRGQRAGRALPHPGGSPDRVGRAGRGRPARPHGRFTSLAVVLGAAGCRRGTAVGRPGRRAC